MFLVGLVLVGVVVFLLLGSDRTPAPSRTAQPSGASPVALASPTPTPARTLPTPTIAPTPSPTPSPTPRPTPTPSPTAAPTRTTSQPPTPAVITSELVGRWQTQAGSWAGYRVVIDVPFFGESEVVGRTDAITGSADVQPGRGETLITGGRFVGDLRVLTSGDRIVDNQVRRLLQVDAYPTAEFVITRPVALPPDAQLRAGAIVPLPGRLSLLGQSQEVIVPATFVYDGTTLTVAASIDFALSQFGVSTNQGVFSVADQATFLFELRLERGG